jgi:hypothetical protein
MCRRRMNACTSFSASLLCLTGVVLATGAIAATDPPLPRERPETAPNVQSSAPKSDTDPSPCQIALRERASFKPAPAITGPGECKAVDVVVVDAILLPDKTRAVVSPPATLRCPMADAVAQWIIDDVAPALAASGTSLRSIETLDSFDCRPRNGIAGAPVSEHGRADALDVRALGVTGGAVLELTSASTAKPLREKLRESACARFDTVLGNGADAYHESHVHIDLMERNNNYKMCQWEVLDPAEAAALAVKKIPAARIPTEVAEAAEAAAGGDIPLPRSRHVSGAPEADIPRQSMPGILKEETMRAPVALSVAATLATSAMTYAQEQTVTVGPWTIAAAYKGDRFDNCSMNRSVPELDVTFVRSQDGLLLILGSPKWKLDSGKAYTVRLVTGPRAFEAKALAEPKTVTIALADRALNEGLRMANVLEVKSDGATLRVPLDGSTAALARLEACFDKNSQSGVDSNPFVAPNRKP